MNTKKIAYFLIISMLIGAGRFAYASQEDNRYLVKTTAGFWKKSFGVRHNFDNGFTADLSDFQLKLAKIFNVEVEPVKKLSILPAEAEQSVSKGKPAMPRQTPSETIPWGVKTIYNDPILIQPSGGVGVKVAVLDTGVLKSHPDLKNRIIGCKDFTSAKVPLIDGKCEDKNGHGTHVAGIIAADGGDDGLGIYGIAPEAEVLAYKVCGNNGSCWADDIAVALRNAADNGVQIVNLSLGSDTPSQLITDAILYAVSKNVLVVAAAGNDGPYVGSIDYPGASVDVIGVGAIDINMNITDWSSRGINSLTVPYITEEGDIEFAAPGVNIESTWKDSGYAIMSGTSMATPHVAGLAAKLWQADALSNAASATRDILHKHSIDLLPLLDDDASGWGLPRM
ncbi:MAG: Thermostable serine protease [Candidatus Yanofskybacteria bacterium GW2011_GWA2_41_22]|uniref:Peptidase S8/S53 domain-containing protein n=4 Tax=Candidatus Yanofskyibacteriota TaxID=1752733 RepID=A0A1F8HWF9_9BACT|nr:MAG: Thermostable serine protease [Candidatus Yanofskybacteria bacterium GW2011_GWA2_41_22]KKS25782.1 MAG: Thermostable serine protease [Candidatus Yanofskybacteria bacterium GW2011_GWC2_41_9]OGM99911.1 MAG: hypothetical protein A2736_03015 [Candidatus Yanofskybacteria bacterium RIFCSPHIGHO2_01_FULL_41_27]OGN20794.1 MAG: hypothetical protein A3B00_00465 [Candidatus Yanofskybacteria bacterium RIFCSPLOWO2_01_FULL_41_33]OGN41469.1 MAG: hypothetical protein A2606_03585 [Candidatus Yanofskybacter